MGTTTRGQGTTRMVLAAGQGTPLGVCLEKASPSEVTLLDRTLDSVHASKRRGKGHRPHAPEGLIADRGDDSTGARALWVRRAVEPIIPRRRHNTIATHQDGRKLRRDRRRWSIERTNWWLQNFRRLVVRYERHLKHFEAMVHPVCTLVTLKKVSG